jgi:ABC-2 type transport system permease protein
MSSSDFDLVTETGWRMGLSNLLNKELRVWFGSSVWWQQALLWSAILGMFSTIGLQNPAGFAIFYMMSIIFPSIATIIISQEKIIEEKKMGSAAWVLSKPVSRTSFIISKLVSLGLGVTVSMIMIPGTVVYLIAAVAGAPPGILDFYGGLAILALWQVFLVFLTICIGTFFDAGGPVMAAPFFFVFFGVNLGMHPVIGPFGPWGLYQIAIALVQDTVYPITPLVVTLAALVGLTGIAIWRFGRHEF